MRAPGDKLARGAMSKRECGTSVKVSVPAASHVHVRSKSCRDTRFKLRTQAGRGPRRQLRNLEATTVGTRDL
eukprot:5710620-Alexandrium_andersonii.AAC.1